MLLNEVRSEGVIATGLFCFIFGLVCLLVYCKNWTFVADQPYRKYRGLNTVNSIFVTLAHVLMSFVFALLEYRKVILTRQGCVILITYELCQLLTLFSWFIVKIVGMENSLRMYRWPSLNFLQACLVGYVIPNVFGAVFMTVLFFKPAFVICTIDVKQNFCSIDSCNLGKGIETCALFSILFLMPMLIIIGLYIFQNIRSLIVANNLWNIENLSFKEKLNKFKHRDGIQRDQIYIIMLCFTTVISATTVFTGEKISPALKPLYTACFSANLIVIFVVECLMGRKKLNPFIAVQEWCLKTLVNQRRHTRHEKDVTGQELNIITQTKSDEGKMNQS